MRKHHKRKVVRVEIPHPHEVAPVTVGLCTLWSESPKGSDGKAAYLNALEYLVSYLDEMPTDKRVGWLMAVALCSGDLTATLAQSLAFTLDRPVTDVVEMLGRTREGQ